MPKTPQPVKPTGQQGDKEAVLAQRRLERRKADYEKLCVKIERRQRKLDRDQRAVTSGVKALAKFERDRRRMQKAMARAEADAATALVMSTVEAPAVKPDFTEDKPKPNGNAVRAIPLSEAHPHSKRGPKRPRGMARLAHLAKDLPEAAREAAVDQGLIPPDPTLDQEVAAVLADAEREVRMKGLGFRKTPKRGK